MGRRTLVLQNQIRSTTSGIEYDDTLDLAFAENLANDSPLVDPLGISGTLIYDLNFLRTAVRDIKGSATEINWFDAAVDNGNMTTLSGARGSLDNLHTFTGSTGDLDSSPDYDTLGGSAPVFISQGDAVNIAIEKLDAGLATVSGSLAGEIAKQRHIRTGGQVPADTTLDLSDLIAGQAGWTSEGDTLTWTSAADFVESVSVFLNGVLQLPGVNIGADRDVYFIGTPDQMAFSFKIRSSDVIQVWLFPPV
ncbi:hypothetical protein LCGC14_1702540 [marine sediment metagenome]|uniref:Uncharacterized protein n=1 Tax=marine sediment metagenome TaxID=412755 RepID=A0A0F9HHZ8_9ZZZZ